MWLGAYGIWKWSDEAASKVTVRDTIFRLDMPSYSSCSSQEWPEGPTRTSRWCGPATQVPDRGRLPQQAPEGRRLTTDLGVWRTAKGAWLDE